MEPMTDDVRGIGAARRATDRGVGPLRRQIPRGESRARAFGLSSDAWQGAIVLPLARAASAALDATRRSGVSVDLGDPAL